MATDETTTANKVVPVERALVPVEALTKAAALTDFRSDPQPRNISALARRWGVSRPTARQWYDEFAGVPVKLPVEAVEVSATCERDNLFLLIVAYAFFGVGLASNGWFAQSLGSTEVAGYLFLAVGLASDAAAFILPDRAACLWRQRRLVASGVAWSMWSLMLVFALIASVGFASLNIADTIITRAAGSNPAIEEAAKALADAKGARDRECVRVGPICRQRENEVVDRQHKLDNARGKIVADPQTQNASALVAWVTRGSIVPSADDLAMLRLMLLTLLPQLGGLIRMVARRR